MKLFVFFCSDHLTLELLEVFAKLGDCICIQHLVGHGKNIRVFRGALRPGRFVVMVNFEVNTILLI
jgi:hypothetical protein